MTSPAHNTAGLAITIDGQVPAKVEFVSFDGFLFIRDIHGKERRVFRTDFTPFMKQNDKSKAQCFFDATAWIWTAALTGSIRLATEPFSPLQLMKLLKENRDDKNEMGFGNPQVDEKLWLDRAERVKFSVDGPYLWLNQDLGHLDYAMPAPVSFTYNYFTELERLCFLAPMMTPRQIFFVENLTKDKLDSLERRYDVTFIPAQQKQGAYYIL